jgi:PAS domain S-box-containing protein
MLVTAAIRDVTERKRVEAELLENQKRLAQAQEIAHMGSWEWNITSNTVRWSDELYRIYGLKPNEFPATYEGYMARIHPDDRARVHEAVQRSYRTQAPFEFEERIVRPSGEVRWLQSQGRVSQHPARMTGTCQDITERKRSEAELAARAAALERSNEELEHFAYVASHDLQEPLRTVASYTQLLQKRFAPEDLQAQEFARFITEGVHRMQSLITDLLAYSRVGRRVQPFADVDLAGVLDDALSNLRGALTESGGAVTRDPLPTVHGDALQLAQVLQNLLSNALKFRGPHPPRIHVSAVEDDAEWVIAVSDNGIGIEPGYFDKMFVLFQRLHGRDHYPGTGLGLAICKKIVSRHGGRIWVESEGTGCGTTFRFSLPKSKPRT